MTMNNMVDIKYDPMGTSSSANEVRLKYLQSIT